MTFGSQNPVALTANTARRGFLKAVGAGLIGGGLALTAINSGADIADLADRAAQALGSCEASLQKGQMCENMTLQPQPANTSSGYFLGYGLAAAGIGLVALSRRRSPEAGI